MKILTFGCFSIVHAGHFDLFRLSKELATDSRLTVAIAVDKVVRAAKGPKTPIYSLRERIAMIQGCRYVDAITFYGQEIPQSELDTVKSYETLCKCVQGSEIACVDSYKPDVITFGEDKTLDFYDHIRGVELIQLPRLGGKITSTDIVKQLSEDSSFVCPGLPDNYDRTV